MTVLPITIYGEPVLHKPTKLVELDKDNKPSPEVNKLIDDMYETLAASKGVGLAATQVGVGLRLFVYDCPFREADGKVEYRKGEVINPILTTSEIPETMPEENKDEEGCLSFPGENYPTNRANWAKVSGYDRNGNPIEIEGTDFFARMLQHETGHLEGIIYVDTLIGRWKRAAKKALKQHGWGKPGLTWIPGIYPDPFADEEEEE